MKYFLKSNEFKLIVQKEKSDFNNIKSGINTEPNNEVNLENYDLDAEIGMEIHLITDNLTSDVKEYFIDIVKKKDLNIRSNPPYVMDYPVAYTTGKDFIGTVHKGYGYEYFILKKYKDGIFSSWKTVENSTGGDDFWVDASGVYWRSYYRSGSEQLKFIVYKCRYQDDINYRIYYVQSDFRGHDCSIGSYDYANCYIGTPPSGSTASFYTDGNGNTYRFYTKINGTCPVGWSWSAGAGTNKCGISPALPSGTSHFIYNNSWYVKPNLIF